MTQLLALGLGIECVLLALLSHLATTNLFALVYRVSHHKNFSLSLLTILLFPGTIIHELSHLFTAEILGVRTGKLSLTPEGIEGIGGIEGQWGREGQEGKEIRTGSVAIAKTDPIRRTIIGLAPVFVGLLALMAVSYFLPINWTDWNNWTNSKNLLLLYLLFAVSNSMFSSREDMKGVIPVFLTLGLFAGAAYVAGFRFSLTGQAEVFVVRVLESLTKSLGLVLAVNGVILLTVKVLLGVIGKIRSSAGR